MSPSRNALRGFFATILLVAGTGACSHHDHSTPSAEARLASAPVAVTSTAAPSTVRVDFRGAIVHVLNATPPRAAVLKHWKHESSLEIVPPTYVALDASSHHDMIASRKRLEKALAGSSAKVVCRHGGCIITNLTGLTVRVVDQNGQPITGALAPATGFQTLVPGLMKAGNIPQSDLDKDLAEKLPKGDFRAFFLLNGGTLDATAYSDSIFLCPDYESRNPRDVANVVTLSGSTTTRARLEFGRVLNAQTQEVVWQPVELDDAKDVNLVFDNTVPNSLGPHFAVHERVSESNNVKGFPDVKFMPCERTDRHAFKPFGSTVACGNTQYP